MQVYIDYLVYLSETLSKFGISVFDNNSDFVGYKKLADKINETYRENNFDEDEEKELISILHEVCNLLKNWRKDD